MKRILILVSLIALTSFAQKQELSTTQTMHQSLEAITKLLPYISHEMKYTDPKNQKFIQEQLNKLLINFKSGRHNVEFTFDGFQPSYETIQEHLQETLDTFNSSNKDFSFSLARSITPLCLSCHNQLPNDFNSSFSMGLKKIKPDHFESNFDYAEFLYLVRDYKAAEKTYEKVVSDKLANPVQLKVGNEVIDYESSILSQSLRKILEINLRIKRDYNSAQKYFMTILKNKNLPASDKSNISIWLASINQWKKKSNNYLKVTNADQLKTFMNKYLVPLKKEGISITEEHTVDMFITSGVLTNYLFRFGNKENTPQVLLWMGIAENILGKNIFYTLGDQYLKNCVEKYPQSPAARECFNELKDSTEFKYTGSSGTNIPSSVQKQLNRLESMLNKKGK